MYTNYMYDRDQDIRAHVVAVANISASCFCLNPVSASIRCFVRVNEKVACDPNSVNDDESFLVRHYDKLVGRR